MRKLLTFLILLTLLVGFPTASYFYMKDGFEYRKRAIEAQGDYGKMPDLQALTPLQGQLPEALRGSMLVAGWLDVARPEAAYMYGHMLDSLYQQFKDSPNLYFTTITTASDSSVAAWASAHGLPQDPMLSILRADSSTFVQTAQNFQLPGAPGQDPIVAMVDSSLTIRSHYNLEKRDETIGLVQLISLIIPLPAKGDIIVAPKKEL